MYPSEIESGNDEQENLCDLFESGVGSKETSGMPQKQENAPVFLCFARVITEMKMVGRAVSKYVQTWIPTKSIDIQTERSCAKCEEYKVTVRQLQQRNS